MDQYVGEIRMFAGKFAPVNWGICDGRLLQISEYETLFSLIGTTYGGDGQTTFALPDLTGRVPVHQGPLNGGGTNYSLGQKGGKEEVTLNVNEMPQHTHQAFALNGDGDEGDPTNHFWAGENPQFSTNDPDDEMNADTIETTGGGQAHHNIMPYQAINFIISLSGVYPSQN